MEIYGYAIMLGAASVLAGLIYTFFVRAVGSIGASFAGNVGYQRAQNKTVALVGTMTCIFGQVFAMSFWIVAMLIIAATIRQQFRGEALYPVWVAAGIGILTPIAVMGLDALSSTREEIGTVQTNSMGATVIISLLLVGVFIGEPYWIHQHFGFLPNAALYNGIR